jgi:hypothetical protein
LKMPCRERSVAGIAVAPLVAGQDRHGIAATGAWHGSHAAAIAAGADMVAIDGRPIDRAAAIALALGPLLRLALGADRALLRLTLLRP